MEKFCTDYIALGGRIAGMSMWFLYAALAVGVAFAIVDLIVRLRGTGAQLKRASLTDGFAALKDLVAALAAAPIWLALFAVGIVLFWVPGDALGVCKPSTEQTSQK
jgi:hypothetical protein